MSIPGDWLFALWDCPRPNSNLSACWLRGLCKLSAYLQWSWGSTEKPRAQTALGESEYGSQALWRTVLCSDMHNFTNNEIWHKHGWQIKGKKLLEQLCIEVSRTLLDERSTNLSKDIPSFGVSDHSGGGCCVLWSKSSPLSCSVGLRSGDSGHFHTHQTVLTRCALYGRICICYVSPLIY